MMTGTEISIKICLKLNPGVSKLFVKDYYKDSESTMAYFNQVWNKLVESNEVVEVSPDSFEFFNPAELTVNLIKEFSDV